jgi:hypothetical protein
MRSESPNGKATNVKSVQTRQQPQEYVVEPTMMINEMRVHADGSSGNLAYIAVDGSDLMPLPKHKPSFTFKKDRGGRKLLPEGTNPAKN